MNGDEATRATMHLAGLRLLRRRFRRAHLVGIAGSGMAALAEILRHAGFVVSGSDPKEGATAGHLRHLGITVHRTHAASHVPAGALVVHSAAVPSRNPELHAARARGHLVLARRELLALLMRGACGVAVVGAHGKSTTSGMCALILREAGMKPWAAIGARIPGQLGNALLGASPLLVAEVDESDRSIDLVEPWVAVVTNVDREHIERFGSFRALQASFRSLASRVPAAGTVVANGDDVGAASVTRGIRAERWLAGFSKGAHVRGTSLRTVRGCPRFEIRLGAKPLTSVRLSVPGLMNARNALLAAGAAAALGAPSRAVRDGLASFTGMGRRFELKGELRGITVVDDYAHHPSEIEATIRTARQVYPGRRLVVLFEPHRPSRLAAMLSGFARALHGADAIVVAPLYGAFEEGASIDSGALVERLRARRGGPVMGSGSTEEAVERALSLCRRGDVLLVMGAGEAERMAELLVREIKER